MNTSQYMDKQIMDLASQGSTAQSKDFLDLMKHPEEDLQEDAEGGDRNVIAEDVDGLRPEEIVPSYDFQPIRPITATIPSSKSVSYDGGSATKIWSSDDLKLNSSAAIRNYSSMDTLEPAKVIFEKDRRTFDTSSLVSGIDEAMKKHTDEVLHALEVLSARVTQLESRTRSLENSVDDLKSSVGNNYGNTDGKMRQLENILREVQNGVQVIKDKHDVIEGHLHIAKQQISKPDQPQETHNPTHADTHPLPSVPQQSPQQLPPPSQAPFQHPPPSHVISVPQNQPIPPPPSQIPGQFPQTPQRDQYFPPPSQTQEAPHPPHQIPPYQQPPPHQQYPPPSLPQYSQPATPPANPPQFHPSGPHLEDQPYHPSHTQQYPPPGHHQPPSRPPPQQPPPSQQLYGAPPSHMYEPPPSRSSSGFPSGYGHTPDPYGGPPSQYGSTSPRKPQQSGGGSGYPQLPTARVLPQSLPTASGISSGSGSGGSGNRVPIDDVVDKVTTMGFPREQVRATVRKLTENGHPVDLNIVLDKLMNDSDVQPPRGGWSFGR